MPNKASTNEANSPATSETLIPVDIVDRLAAIRAIVTCAGMALTALRPGGDPIQTVLSLAADEIKKLSEEIYPGPTARDVGDDG